MSGQHTPGTWETEEEVRNEHGNLTGIYVRHVESGRICQTFANCLVDTDEACRANARLIASAPELLAACEAMDAHYSGSLDHRPAYVAMARTALAKATASTTDAGVAG